MNTFNCKQKCNDELNEQAAIQRVRESCLVSLITTNFNFRLNSILSHHLKESSLDYASLHQFVGVSLRRLCVADSGVHRFAAPLSQQHLQLASNNFCCTDLFGATTNTTSTTSTATTASTWAERHVAALRWPGE